MKVEELEILQEVKADKAAGPDGISFRAVKLIAKEMGAKFVQMLNSTIASGRHGGMNKGIIILLPKVAKP